MTQDGAYRKHKFNSIQHVECKLPGWNDESMVNGSLEPEQQWRVGDDGDSAVHQPSQQKLSLMATIVAYDEDNSYIAISDGRYVEIQRCRPEVARHANDDDSSVGASCCWDCIKDAATVGAEEEGSMRHSQVTCMAWLSNVYGRWLLVGESGGRLLVYGCVRQASMGWMLVGILRRPSGGAITCIEAMPVGIQDAVVGPMVAVGHHDGVVRILQGERCAEEEGGFRMTWSLVGDVFPRKRGMGRCTSLAWRGCGLSSRVSTTLAAADIPPLLVIGYEMYAPDMYYYHGYTWTWVKDLRSGDDMSESAAATSAKDGQGTSDVAWAPRGGRPTDLVAVASGRVVTLWSLKGPLDCLTIEKISVLEHDDDVWKLDWNMTGNWLGVSTCHTGEVCLWRADLAGDWSMVNKITSSSMSSLNN